jgi:hypothetical protein
VPPVGGRHPAGVVIGVAGEVDSFKTAVYLLKIIRFSIQLVPLLTSHLAGFTADAN